MSETARVRWGHLSEIRDGRGRVLRLVGDVLGVPFDVCVDKGPTHGDCWFSTRSIRAGGFPLPRGEPLSGLLRRLEALRDPAAVRTASLMRARLAPARTMSFLDGTLDDWDAPELRAYHAGTPAGRRRLRMAMAFPSLSRIVAVSRATRSGVDGIVAAHAMPGRRPAPGHVRRVLANAWTFEHGDVLRALLDLPPEWAPKGAAERAAFARVTAACAPVTAILGDHSHLRGSKGRWTEYEAALSRRIGDRGTLAAAIHDVVDMLGAFADQVGAPAMAAAGLARGWARPYRPGRGVSGAAGRVILGDKGLPAILELSLRWHGRQGGIDAVVGAAGGGRGRAWPAPFPALRSPQGLDLVPLATQDELVAEGGPVADGGLGHCVGGYGRACSEGRAVVVSVREGGRRLSTLELDLSGPKPRMVQHKAASNAMPGDRDAAAAGWLVTSLMAGEVRVSAEYRDPSWRDPNGRRLDHVCGYDWRSPEARGRVLSAWAPHLPAPAATPEGLAAALSDALARMPDPAAREGPLCKAGAFVLSPLRLVRAVSARAAHRFDAGLARRGGGLDGSFAESAARVGLTAWVAAGPVGCALAVGPGPWSAVAASAAWLLMCPVAMLARKCTPRPV